MSIQGISSGAAYVAPTSTAKTRGASERPPAGGAGGAGGARTMALSPRSSFLGKLQSMAQSDPAQAKAYVSELASKMRERAALGGPDSAKQSALADKLDKAASSGDYTGIFGGSSSGSGSSSSGSSAAGPSAAAYAAMATTRSSW